MLEIEMKLLTLFYPQIDSQTKQINYELEQYLWFFINHKQKDWPEWLATVEFAVNNKIYLAIKIFLFITNYSKELKIEVDIRRKRKVERITKFAERIKKVQEEAGAALRKIQEKMKW